MAEMKTLNGYEIVDEKARNRITTLEESGGSGCSGKVYMNYVRLVYSFNVDACNIGVQFNFPSSTPFDNTLNVQGKLQKLIDILGYGNPISCVGELWDDGSFGDGKQFVYTIRSIAFNQTSNTELGLEFWLHDLYFSGLSIAEDHPNAANDLQPIPLNGGNLSINVKSIEVTL